MRELKISLVGGDGEVLNNVAISAGRLSGRDDQLVGDGGDRGAGDTGLTHNCNWVLS